MARSTWWKLKQILTQLTAGLSDRGEGEEGGVRCEQGSELPISRDARSFTGMGVGELLESSEGDTSKCTRTWDQRR